MSQKLNPAVLAEFVRTYERRSGLRKLYRDYNISEPERYLFRKAWNRFVELMPDAYEKRGNQETPNASQISETAEDDGDS